MGHSGQGHLGTVVKSPPEQIRDAVIELVGHVQKFQEAIRQVRSAKSTNEVIDSYEKFGAVLLQVQSEIAGLRGKDIQFLLVES